jgi:hypothetical protein
MEKLRTQTEHQPANDPLGVSQAAAQEIVNRLLEVVFYIATAVAIRGIPSAPVTRYYITDYLLPATLPNLLFALIALAGAWLLSSWVYGTGPLRTLSNYRNKLSRKTNA